MPVVIVGWATDTVAVSSGHCGTGSGAGLMNRIRRMPTDKKNTFSVQRTPKAKKRRVTAKKVRKAAPQRLKAPRWVFWFGRPGGVSLRQAALLTMGLAPEAGIVALLKDKVRKKNEFRKRERELEAAYGISKWIPRANSLPRRVSVRGALEFASEAGWVLAKNAKNALMRARHLEPMDDAVGSQQEIQNPPPVEPIGGVSPLLPSTATDPLAFTSSREQGVSAKSSRKEERTLQVLGAVLVLLHRAEKNAERSRYLRDDAFNLTTLIGEVKAIVAEEKETLHELSGLSDSNIRNYLRDALHSYPLAYPKPKSGSGAEED